MLNGVRISFPDNNDVGKDLVFRAESASTTHTIEPAAPGFGGAIIGQFAEAVEQVGGGDIGKRKQINFDTGGGVHVTTISLSSFKGASGRWGATDGSAWDGSDAGPLAQLQILDNALRKISVGSQAGAVTLETGAYSASGRFEPLQVSPRPGTSLTFDIDAGPSTFSASLEFIDIVQLTAISDAVLRDQDG